MKIKVKNPVQLFFILSFISGFLLPAFLQAQNINIWAASDGVKVNKYDLAHPFKSGNIVWDGDTVRIFGAKNEMVAFQVIVESGSSHLTVNKTNLKELIHEKSPEYRITYQPPDTDPTVYTGRPIQIFNVNYMEVKEATDASWIQMPSLPSAIKDPLGWKPVQLVPENAFSGKGGYPLEMEPFQNQAIWFDIYIEKNLIPGFYLGNVKVETSAGEYDIPVKLEVFDFSLPDKNSLNAMFYYSSYSSVLYMGEGFDDSPGFHRFAHRNRVEFVHAYDIESAKQKMDRFTGMSFIPEQGYEGPGEKEGNIIVPRTFYYTPDEWQNEQKARRLSDEWMNFIHDHIPGAITFLYMPDEPSASEFAFIRTVSDNIHNNPGPGQDLKIFVSHSYTDQLDGYIDIWGVVPGQLDKKRVEIELGKGNQTWFYNGGRPFVGAIVNDAPATDTRMIAWAAFKYHINTYFYWHVDHWFHNHQFGQGEDSPLRKQNVWENTITFDRRPQHNDWANGDGVLIYPGRELIHPEEDRGIEGPVSSVRMANFRRSMQDHLYLTMARRRGQFDLINEALEALVPKVFTELSYDDTIHFENDPDRYDFFRYKLAKAISENELITGLRNNEEQLNDILVYPNPVNNELNIYFSDNNFFKINIVIYDIQGRYIGNPVKSRSFEKDFDHTIDLKTIKPGMYFLKINLQYIDGVNENKFLKLIKM